jgi:hypothetical protein
VSRPLKKTGVDVEDIAGKGFTAGRTAKKKGQFPVRPGVIGEIVVNDEDVPALLHEKLGDACGRVGGYIGESGASFPSVTITTVYPRAPLSRRMATVLATEAALCPIAQ